MNKQLAIAFCLAVLSRAAFADTVTLSGNTLSAPSFNRPTETGARSLFSVSYSVYQFSVSTSGPFNFTLSALDPASYDTFLHVFINAFDPAETSNPALNLLAANDDASGSTTNSALTSLSLTAGTTYFMVVDGFGSSDAGPFTASISGPGTINVVPEPSTVALLAMTGVGAVVVAQRASRKARV